MNGKRILIIIILLTEQLQRTMPSHVQTHSSRYIHSGQRRLHLCRISGDCQPVRSCTWPIGATHGRLFSTWTEFAERRETRERKKRIYCSALITAKVYLLPLPPDGVCRLSISPVAQGRPPHALHRTAAQWWCQESPPSRRVQISKWVGHEH